MSSRTLLPFIYSPVLSLLNLACIVNLHTIKIKFIVCKFDHKVIHLVFLCVENHCTVLVSVILYLDHDFHSAVGELLYDRLDPYQWLHL